ncbi:MAG: enoyl-CoA hydratase/isomerase family protein [Bryobacterales bacterium]|nr:enoyl-CoA hydratase/isomerase family protein [Bryobacterales bacterium]
MSDLVTLSKHGRVAVITIDNPPVNALNSDVRSAITYHLIKAEADEEVDAIVIIGAGRTFIAGADIREFNKITSGLQNWEPNDLNSVCYEIEENPKPVVMAIHGTAFGGGLELAMAGHYRIASPDAQVGQPEVKLGLIPGAGGTQRLPRLAGVAKAAEMCAFGEPISAQEALDLGILDRIVEGDLLSAAFAFAADVASLPLPPKVRDRNAKLAGDHSAALASVRAACGKRARLQKAPLAALEAIEAAVRLPFFDALQIESDLFARCLHSNQSKAMIHAFFGERTVSKIPGIGKEVKPRKIATAAIVGAGTMGGGIAMTYVNAGIPVILKETSQEALDKGLATIRNNYEASVQKGRLKQDFVDKAFARITPVLDYGRFAEADIIVEAVFENLALKKKIFQQLDKVAAPDAILATNTSTLDIDAIAAATSRPDRVVGHHFFSPANVMRLLEIVRGKQTSPEVLVTSLDLARRLKKVGVVAGNCRGFIGNRMFHQYISEAVFLAEDGTPPDQIDRALYNWGMAMGPLAVIDLAGLDVGWRIRQEFKHLERPGVRYAEAHDRLAECGYYGQKTRAGWYLYDDKRKPAGINPAAHEVIASIGRPQSPASAADIVDRCIYALVNEGARILEEGIAIRPVDIDIVYLNGYGFPAWRGGPMWYADTVGLPKVLDRVREFGWEPAPLLVKLVTEDKTFAALEQ